MNKDNYAISIASGKDAGEFYPFARRDKVSILKHIDYLNSYEHKNNMDIRKYQAEKLSKNRMEQFDKEWNRFTSMID